MVESIDLARMKLGKVCHKCYFRIYEHDEHFIA